MTYSLIHHVTMGIPEESLNGLNRSQTERVIKGYVHIRMKFWGGCTI